jgi:hypothetical protein
MPQHSPPKFLVGRVCEGALVLGGKLQPHYLAKFPVLTVFVFSDDGIFPGQGKSGKPLPARLISAAVPQQEPGSNDCGPFATKFLAATISSSFDRQDILNRLQGEYALSHCYANNARNSCLPGQGNYLVTKCWIQLYCEDAVH